MFYVSEGKIYGMQPNAGGKYEEYKVTNGNVRLAGKGKDLDHKPANRQVCSLDEVLAQFGTWEVGGGKEVEETPVKTEPVVAENTK